jgi:hypothetical protein
MVSAQLTNSLLETSGFATTKASALTDKLVSCWIASFSDDAIWIEDVTNEA